MLRTGAKRAGRIYSGNSTSFELPLNDLGGGRVNTSPSVFYNPFPTANANVATFTRASSAWCRLQNGLWTQVPSGVARSHWLQSGVYGGYLTEGQIIQTVPTASQNDMTGWTLSNMTVNKDQPLIDGTPNSCSSLLATSSDATALLAVTCAAGWYSAFVKRLTGTGEVDITTNNGGAWTDVTTQFNALGYLQLTGIASGLNPTIGFRVRTNTDKIAVCFNDIETSATFASSPILGAATRASDTLTYVTNQNFSGIQGTSYAEITTAKSQTNNGFPVIGTFSGSGGNQLGLHTGGIVAFYDDSGWRTSSNAISLPQLTPAKIAVTWSALASAGAVNGSSSVINGFDGNLNLGATTAIANYPSGSGAELFGTTRNVRVWNYALSNAELKGLTT